MFKCNIICTALYSDFDRDCVPNLSLYGNFMIKFMQTDIINFEIYFPHKWNFAKIFYIFDSYFLYIIPLSFRWITDHAVYQCITAWQYMFFYLILTNDDSMLINIMKNLFTTAELLCSLDIFPLYSAKTYSTTFFCIIRCDVQSKTLCVKLNRDYSRQSVIR